MNNTSFYLVFFYIFLISGGFAVNEDIAKEVELRNDLVRQKRYWKTILVIIGTAAAWISAGKDIYDLINYGNNDGGTTNYNHMRSYSDMRSYTDMRSYSDIGSYRDRRIIVIDSLDDNGVRIAAEKLGRAEKIAENLYRVKTTPDAVKCTPEFCRKLGSLGEASCTSQCSAQFCHCDTGDRAHPKNCGPGTVFNPAYKICDWPRNVIGC